MFHIAATTASFVDFDALVGDAVSGGITIGPEVEGVGDSYHHSIIEGENEARQDEIVSVDGVPVISAVAISIDVTSDAAFGLFFPRGVEIPHVGAHLDDIHNAVAVPGDHGRFFHDRITEDEFQLIAFRDFDGLEGVLGGEEAFLIHFISGLGFEARAQPQEEKKVDGV